MVWEFKVLDFIRETFSCGFMDTLMTCITHLAEAGWLWIATGIIMLFFSKTRKIGITVLASLVLNFIICNLTIKPLVGRIRPYDIKTEIELIINVLHDYSFPSGHTAASFTSAVAIFMYNKKWGSAALALAAIIGFTRLYLYVHFPTDVLAGAIIGTICAVISYFVVKFIFEKINDRKGLKSV